MNYKGGGIMGVFRPSYYDSFKCIASKCKHSCCIGWEIDIDEETFEKYRNLSGEMGERIRKSISCEDESVHFILDEKERCPFLNDDNLCDIIISQGDDALCQICRDHPRFVNVIFDREEIGIGFCCEGAAKIIIENKDKVYLLGEGDIEDEVIFNIRDKAVEKIQDRDKSIDERIADVFEMFDISIPEIHMQKVYLSLERLDEAWTEKLQLLNREGHDLKNDWSVPFEQILVYFIYRYMAMGVYDGRYKERILFSVLSFYMIRELFKRGKEDINSLEDIARMYSCEVEYSEENVEKLLNLLGG
ncbi:MAG: flagellin lysine-N-methylase [Clostridia bacterium]